MPLLIRAKLAGGHGWASLGLADDVAKLAATVGAPLVDGTLNLISKTPVWLDARAAIYRNGSRLFWRASLEGMPIVLHRFSTCPAHVFEILATVHLRNAFGLKDDDVVHLEIPDDAVSRSDASLLNRLVWNFFWKYRENHIYRDGIYRSFLLSRFASAYTWRSMQRP